MDKNKLLLIFPRPISEFPTSFAYLNAVAKEKGWECKALVNTFNKYYSQEDIIIKVHKYSPTIIGFNLGTLSLLDTYKTMEQLSNEGYFVIAGGPHATTCPDEVLKRSGAKIVVRNEGEATLGELLDWETGNIDKRISDILGISYKSWDGKKVIHNPTRPYLDFKDIPKPDFDCFDFDAFRTTDGLLKGFHRIYCSRGCIGNCSFCDNNIFKHKVRYRPLDIVIEEIKERHEKYGIESFVIADDTFTFDKEYVKDFCKEIKKLNLSIIWSCSTRADRISDEIFLTMRDAGCYLIGYGIESGDATTLKNIRKGITIKQAHEAVEQASRLGFRVFVNLMTGFPFESEESLRNTYEYVKRHFNEVFVYQVSGSLCPYPGTKVFEDSKDKYGIDKWWLREKYQNFGQQVHQNSIEPYKVSTYCQRHLYDDTYVYEEKFYPFTKKYKKIVKEMAFLIGKRNLLSEQPSRLKRWWIYNLSKLSRFIYEINPRIEKKVVYTIVRLLKFRSHFHNRMPLGAELKLREK
jgi:radical SAM superfamily enzyme YgiQ (UPF0313 family)